MGLPLEPAELVARARRVRALVLDVDGVLTDGRVTYLPGGDEGRTFHVRDGYGIRLVQAAQVAVAVLSGRDSEQVRRWAAELGLDHLSLGVEDKVAAFDRLCDGLGVTSDEVAYVGDDLPDRELLARSALGFAVADAPAEVRQAAHVVLRCGGGQGAVREACERILKAKDVWFP